MAGFAQPLGVNVYSYVEGHSDRGDPRPVRAEKRRPTERSVSRGGGECCGTCRRLGRAAATDTRRWWNATTDPFFLTSTASRRDLWKVLLPLPLLASALAAHVVGDANLAILDASVAFALLCVSLCLPPTTLRSDLLVAAVFTIHVIARDFLRVAEGSAFRASHMLAMVGMAFAGIHSVALAGFLVSAAAAAILVGSAWASEEIMVCAYVLLASAITEKRIARLAADQTLQGFKAMDQIGSAQLSGGPAAGDAAAFSKGLGAGGGDTYSDTYRFAQVPETPEEEMAPPKVASRAEQVAGYIMSKLMPPTTMQPHRFAASKLDIPLAATHAAPEFSRPDLERSGPWGPHDAASPPELGPLMALPEPLSDDDEEAPPATPHTLPPSPQGPKDTLRGIKLRGFQLQALNVLFVEKPEPETSVGGRETYWSAAGDYFLYYSAATSTWGAAKAKRFQQVQEGTTNGVAHSPEGFDINHSSPASSKGWSEWSSAERRWVGMPGAGVESRGKVRRKQGPTEREVQTELTWVRTEHPEPAEISTQTDA